MALPAVTTEIIVVFGLILTAVVLFATEFVSPDVTAISVLVAVVVLEPWTGVGTETAFVGFTNTATITVAAMYMLSEGIYRTGIVRRLGVGVSRFAGGSESRLLGTTLVLTGGMAGIAPRSGRIRWSELCKTREQTADHRMLRSESDPCLSSSNVNRAVTDTKWGSEPSMRTRNG